MLPTTVVKRNGAEVPFDRYRIAAAIDRAQRAVGQEDAALADELAGVVVDHLDRTVASGTPDIESVQDAVIHVLQESGVYDVALAYTRYRDQRERARRHRRLDGDEKERPNITVVGRDGRSRPWQPESLESMLRNQHDLSAKVAADVRHEVEFYLASSEATEIGTHLLLSLVDAALVRHGLTSVAEERSPIRVDRQVIRDVVRRKEPYTLGRTCGGELLETWSLAECLPVEVRRLYQEGRLWVDGLDDPQRGSHFTAALDGRDDPWQVIADAFSLATDARADWRRVTLVLPPLILGHLEREGRGDLVATLERLSMLAEVYLYCDGRTPLLENWPFESKNISIATYAQDFLILRQLQALNLEHLSGPGLMQGGYRRRVAVSLALNAQGLDDSYSKLDHLAMGLVAAAKVRLQHLDRSSLAGASVRYAIYGLPPGSVSTAYLERQVVQEGLRSGIALTRTSQLSEKACEHLGRLFTVNP